MSFGLVNPGVDVENKLWTQAWRIARTEQGLPGVAFTRRGVCGQTTVAIHEGTSAQPGRWLVEVGYDFIERRYFRLRREPMDEAPKAEG